MSYQADRLIKEINSKNGNTNNRLLGKDFFLYT